MHWAYLIFLVFMPVWQDATCAKYYCPLMIAIDETYYVHFQSNTQFVTQISQNLVKRVNQIYSK